jgi:hypothetical protein
VRNRAVAAGEPGATVQPARCVQRLKRELVLVVFTLIASTVGSAGAGLPAAASPVADQTSTALLPANRIVAYYGNPLAPTLGRLGESPPDQMIARLHETAAYYSDMDPSRPVKPARELITPLAQASPGDDRMYRARMSSDLIDQVAGWASDNDLLLVLNVQVGRSSVDAELQPLLPYLRRPNTHLALDPEFAMGPGQVPGQAIGSLDASDVNTAVKTSRYGGFIGDAGAEFGGIKLFYNYDSPMLEPDAVLNLTPAPDVVIYQ